MKTYTSIDTFEQGPAVVLTIGTFDGVHVGHLQLINRLKTLAEQVGGEVVVLTFHPHPRQVVQKEGNPVRLLTNLREKEVHLAAAGVDKLVVQPFDADFSEITASQFIQDVICNRLHAKILVVGYDHRFGKGRTGSFNDLQSVAATGAFQLEKIPEQVIDHITISSTQIRNALRAGDIKTANQLLGWNYSVSGTVIHGEKLGRKLGFPTANLHPESDDKLIPGEGVFAGMASLDSGKYRCLISIGKRPTVKAGGALSVEAYLMDFDEDIYGKVLTIEFLEKLRDDRKFESLDALVQQMNEDKRVAQELFENNKFTE